MKWNHIRDCQPEDGAIIIHLEPPVDLYQDEWKKHYSMGMRKYFQNTPWQEFLDACKSVDIDPPDFWWIYAKDFPFPEIKNNGI